MKASNIARCMEQLTFAFLFIGLLMSYQLWISDRSFPLVPIWGFGGLIFDYPYDYLLLGTSFIAILLNLFIDSWKVKLVTIFLLGILLLQDQVRWQPWVYIYLIILGLFLFQKFINDKQFSLNSLVILFSGVYFWSGLYKINESFIHLVYRKLILIDFLKLSPRNDLFVHLDLGYIIPLIEMAIGLGLLFKRSRIYSVVLGVSMHIGIIYVLSPFGIGHNLIVIPWNLFMILIMLLLCKINIKGAFKNVGLKRVKIYLPIIIIAYILPSLNKIGLWDHYASFKLYTEDYSELYVGINETEVENLSEGIKQHLLNIKLNDDSQLQYFNVSKWCFKELGVPLPPERRIYRSIAKHFCHLGIEYDHIKFLEYPKQMKKLKGVSYQCSDIIND